MPELPEVEVTKRGIEQVLIAHSIIDVFFSDKKLRVPLSDNLLNLKNAKVLKVERRAKYIIIFTTQGSLIIHLGMTGHLQIIDSSTPRIKHDHVEIFLDSKLSIRFNDSRRFGLVVFVEKDVDPYSYPLLSKLGVEPLSDEFNAAYLLEKLAKRTVQIKPLLMDSKIVVGVGNIYACEALFASKVDPTRKANTITAQEAQDLVCNIKHILTNSIASGGTTIRDFEGADGKPGYFVQNLKVYGHGGEECSICHQKIERIVQAQRSTFYCPHCQH